LKGVVVKKGNVGARGGKRIKNAGEKKKLTGLRRKKKFFKPQEKGAK